MKSKLACLILLLLQTACTKSKQIDANSPEAQEALMVISNINRHTLAYCAVATDKMLAEANFFSDRLKLPTSHPIMVTDVIYPYVSPPWSSVTMETNSFFWPATVFSNHIFDASIPREQRLRALKVAVKGVIETTNFFFAFANGRLRNVQRLSEHEVEYYAKDLDKLIGKPSLITDSQAHELATKWLAAVDVDVLALEKEHPPEINRLRYLPKGSTNTIELPFYFVHWGWQYYSNATQGVIGSAPIVEVKILGTTRELVELHMLDTSFSRRPLMIVTNALELIRTPDPPVMHLQSPSTPQTNAATSTATNAPAARPPPFHMRIK